MRCSYSISSIAIVLAGCGAGTAAIASGGGDSGGSSNGTPVLSNFTVESPEVAPARIKFILSDQEGDPARVTLSYSVGGKTPQLVTQLTGVAGNPALCSSSPDGVAYDLSWRFTGEPDLSPTGSFVDEVRVSAVLENGVQELVLGANGDFGLGNDPPELAIEPIAGEFDGVVPIRFVVSDTSDDLVSIRAEYHVEGEPESEWHVARPAGLAQGADTPDDAFVGQAAPREGLELVFFWDTDIDLTELERDVRVRFTARDPIVPGGTVATNTFRIDNNAEPIAVLHGDLLVTSPDDTRGIPIPFSVSDEEGDAVEIVFQWARPGESFPDLPATPEAIRAALADPSQRSALRVCSEFPRWLTGRIRPIDASTVELPELVSMAPHIVQRGLAGRTLEILRPPLRLEPITREWASNPLRTTVATVPIDDGLDVLVLDSNGEGAWRVVQVELASGVLVRELASGSGSPSQMTMTRDGSSVLVVSSVGASWRIDRVDLESGSVVELVGEQFVPEPGIVRGIASLGTNAGFVTVNDKLLRVDWSDAAAPKVGTVVRNLATPWGVVVDPVREGHVYVAESDAVVANGVGRVVSIDVESKVVEPVIALDFELAGNGLPRPREIALTGGGAQLLALCETDDGKRQLRRVELGRATYVSGLGAYSVVAPVLLDTLPSGARGLAAGEADLALFCGARSDSLFAAGGIEMRRTIDHYDRARRRAHVTPPFLPAPEPGASWRIADALGAVPADGGLATFVWDSEDALRGPVLFRITPLDAEVGTPAESLAPKTVASPYQRKTPCIQGPFGPRSVVAGDVNSDGLLDIVASMQASGANEDEIVVKLNSGHVKHIFGPEVSYGFSLSNVVDLDGDGDTDVVASSNGELSVLWQTSPLTFERAEIAVNGTTSVRPYDVGDMDGDGDLDVVIFAQLSSGFFRLRVVRQTSPGVFSPVSTAIGGNVPQVFDAGVADMDGDGDLDVLMATSNATQGSDFGVDWLAVFWQSQPGVFATTPTHVGTYPDIDDPYAVHAADLDRDGQLDVLTTNLYTNEVLIYRQVGEHEFASSPLRLGGAGVLDRPYFVRVSDFDSDGDLDVLAHNGGTAQSEATSPRLKVFLQQQDGSFDPVPRGIDDRIESFYGVADYDGDGRLDILGRDNENDDDSIIDVFRRPQFGDAESDPTVLGNQTQGLLAGVRAVDLDSDGDKDLLTPGPRVRWQVRPREFSPTPTPLMTPAELLMPLVGDLDGDGDLDLIGMRSSSIPGHGDLAVLWQVSQGQFESSTLFEGSDRTLIPSLGPIADVDGDGDVDVLATLLEVGVESPETPVAFDQVRPGEFELDLQPFGDLSRFEVLNVGFVEDIDQDGKLDLVCRSRASWMVLWRDESGGFESVATILPAFFAPGSFVDLDGDGDLDIVGRSQNDARVYWQVAHREFGSTPTTFFMLNCGSGNGARVQAVDFDKDGDLDLVTGSCGMIQVHRQLGAGTFDPQPLIEGTPETTSFPLNPNAVDLDGDGDLELLGEQSNFTMKIYWGSR